MITSARRPNKKNEERLKLIKNLVKEHEEIEKKKEEAAKASVPDKSQRIKEIIEELEEEVESFTKDDAINLL
jgi:predicted transcriptional regulator